MIISGITTLLVAANSKQTKHVCQNILIGIKGNEGKFYVEKEDVLNLMETTTSNALLQKAISNINLSALETELKTNPWIKAAELYFDSKDALHVFVEQREPIARVFSTEGHSFYIDSSGNRMPLLDKISIRVPVFTGFVSQKKLRARDSLLLEQVKQVAQFIYGNKFWNAQVGQIDITPERKFELIPVIGNHIIKLGEGENIEDKLNKLYVFYKQVMSKVGFNKYAALDVQFNGQVIAVKKEPASPVDSIQLQKNIEELMNRASMQSIDADMLPDQSLNIIKTDSTVSTTVTQNSVSTKTNPNPSTVLKQSIPNSVGKNTAKKTQTQSKPIEKPKQNVKSNKAKPKAVMPGPL